MRKLFKNIGMICLALAVAVGSLFVPMRKPNQSYMASADTVSYDYAFNGSSIYVPLMRNASAGYKYIDLINFYPSFSRLGDSFTFSLHDTTRILAFQQNGNDNFLGTIAYCNYDVDTSTYSKSFTIDISDMTNNYYGRVLFSLSYSGNNLNLLYQYGFWLFCNSSEFNGNISMIRLYNSQFDFNGVTNLFNVISYIDNNGNYLNFLFRLPDLNFTNAVFSDRTYYLNNVISDSDIYNQGYNAGLTANQSVIYDSAYESGYLVGYDRGIVVGGANANDYSFISLFGAIFDAPITMLTGLLNFEFLGINLWAFVTSLFTLALVLYIIKLVMGR